MKHPNLGKTPRGPLYVDTERLLRGGPALPGGAMTLYDLGDPLHALRLVLRGVSARALPDEALLQGAIASRLVEAGMVHQREVPVGPRERIDFVVGSIGVEVKMKGGFPNVLRQLDRYARSDLRELLLVTTLARHRGMPPELRGKPLHVEYLCPL